MLVVDLLEMVDVQHHQAGRFIGGVVAAQRGFGLLLPVAAVIQAREGVDAPQFVEQLVLA